MPPLLSPDILPLEFKINAFAFTSLLILTGRFTHVVTNPVHVIFSIVPNARTLAYIQISYVLA